MKEKKFKSPGFGYWLICRLFSKVEHPTLIGDFEEIFSEIAREKGRMFAWSWYWGQIIRAIPSYIKNQVYWSSAMLKNYLKMTIRNVLKHKGYSFINIFGFAIGIACCLLIILYVQDELSYDKFHEQANRIYRIDRAGSFKGQAYHMPITSHPTGPAMEMDVPEIKFAVRLWPRRLNLKNWANDFFEERVIFADKNLFQVFTFTLVKGNPEKALEDPNSMVLTEAMAKKYFNDSDPLGKTISVNWRNNELSFRVTGIMENIPRNSHIKTGFFASYATLPPILGENMKAWMNNSVYTYVLINREKDPARVEAKFPQFIEKHLGKLARSYLGPKIDINKLMRFQLHPLLDIHLYSNLEWELEPNGSINTVFVFSAVALLILLIACINFMNLSTARSALRAREVGLRKTVGANKGNLVKQFIGESIIITFIAGVISVLLVQICLPFYNTFTLKSMSNFFLSDPLSMIYFILFMLVVGIIAGSYPAFFLSAFKPVKVLRGAKTSGDRNRSQFLRQGMVVLQFSISVVLIIGTIMVMRQLNFIKNRNLGFKKERVVVINAKDNSLSGKIDSVRQELKGTKGVLNVATSSNIPGARLFSDRVFSKEGSAKEDMHDFTFFSIDSDFIPLMDIKIAAGRNFSKKFPSDIKEGLILNELAVEQMGWDKPETALGKSIYIVGSLDDPNSKQVFKVVGVVKNFHFKSLHQKLQPLVLFNNPTNVNFVNVKISAQNIPLTLNFLQKKWKTLSPQYTFEYFFLDDNFDQLYRAEERVQTIFKSFTLLAIFISCLGLLGLASFTAERRTKEVGIRKVLGASVANITLNLSREFVVWVLVANCIAWPIAYYAMKTWLQNFHYRTSLGIEVFLLGGLLSIGIAILTVSYQTIRAALADPVKAIKYE
jgi:putative ABC transport system permease protein